MAKIKRRAPYPPLIQSSNKIFVSRKRGIKTQHANGWELPFPPPAGLSIKISSVRTKGAGGKGGGGGRGGGEGEKLITPSRATDKGANRR